jgi:hypothetical protein
MGRKKIADHHWTTVGDNGHQRCDTCRMRVIWIGSEMWFKVPGTPAATALNVSKLPRCAGQPVPAPVTFGDLT